AQPQLRGDLRPVELGGQQVLRHVRPAQVLEGAHLIGEDRVAGEDHHPVLAGELAESPGVIRALDGAVAVQVQAGGHARVHGGGEGVGVEGGALPVLRHLEVLLAEEVHAASLVVVVELVEQQDVGAVDLDDLGDRPDLGVLPGGEVLEQLPLPAAVQGGVEGRGAQRLERTAPTRGLRGGGGGGGGGGQSEPGSGGG